MKAKFHLIPPGVIFSLPPGLLGRSFEGTQTPHLIQYPIRIDLALQAFQRPIDGFSSTNNYFSHNLTYFLLFIPFLQEGPA